MKLIKVEELMEKPFSEITKKECLNEKETVRRLGGLKEKFIEVAKKEEKLKQIIQNVVVFENDGKKYAIDILKVQRIIPGKEGIPFKLIDIRKNKEMEGYIILYEVNEQIIGVKVECVDEVATVMLIEEFHQWKKTYLRESKNRLIFSMIE